MVKRLTPIASATVSTDRRSSNAPRSASICTALLLVLAGQVVERRAELAPRPRRSCDRACPAHRGGADHRPARPPTPAGCRWRAPWARPRWWRRARSRPVPARRAADDGGPLGSVSVCYGDSGLERGWHGGQSPWIARLIVAVPAQHLVLAGRDDARRPRPRRLPCTTVWRADTGPHRSHASTGSLSAPANATPSSGQHTRSPAAPGASSARSRPRARGSRPTRGSRSPARRARPSTADPCACGRAAARCAPPSRATRESVDAEPSQPSPTGTPAARNSGTGAMPAAADHHVRARAVRDARAPLAEPQRSRPRSGRCSARPTTRSLPHPTSSNCSIVRRPKTSSRVRVLVGVLGEVRVQPHVESLGELGGGAHQLGRDRERRARRERDAHHRAPRRVVVQRDEPFAVGEDLVVGPARPSRAGDRRPSATGSSSRASGGSGTPSSCAARISARDEITAAARVHVEVIGARGAAAERELGQPDPRRHVRRFLVEQRPARVQRGEPLEQRAVHRRPVAAGEVLVDVMVRVDQARRHQAAVGVEHPRRVGQRVGRRRRPRARGRP